MGSSLLQRRGPSLSPRPADQRTLGALCWPWSTEALLHVYMAPVLISIMISELIINLLFLGHQRFCLRSHPGSRPGR